jgi:hypothetical protein
MADAGLETAGIVVIGFTIIGIESLWSGGGE